MRRAIAAPFLAILVLVAGCASVTPETPAQRLAAASIAFQEVMDTVVEVSTTVPLSEGQKDVLEGFVRSAKAALDAYKAVPDAAHEDRYLQATRALQGLLTQFLAQQET